MFCAVERDFDAPVGSQAAATIYLSDGVRPARDAMVAFYDVSSVDSAPAAVYFTDADGHCPIIDPFHGVCNIRVEKDSFVLIQDSVVIAGTNSTLRSDTLEAPSLLAGTVALSPHHDPRTVTIRLIGLGSRFTVRDPDGAFLLTGLARGSYRLLVETPLPEYASLMRSVFISGKSPDTLRDTLRPRYSGIPVVSGLRISQDTLAGSVRISWLKTDYPHFQDYVLFRNSCAGGVSPSDLRAAIIDTFFIDSVGFSRIADPRDTATSRFTYRVALRSKMQVIGPVCDSAALPFAPKALATTFMSHRIGYPVPGIDSASPGDTVIISLSARNPTRPLSRLIWKDSFSRLPLSVIVAPDSGQKELSDTLRRVFDAAGTHRIFAAVADKAGTVRADTIPVMIVQDAPLVGAGGDTDVLAGGIIRLHGSARQRFGSITRWEWKIGTGTWTPTFGPDTAFTAPGTEQLLACSLAAVDDDGNRSTDGMNVSVSLQVLSVAAGRGHTLILKTDGSLWACGDNSEGQCGTYQWDDIYRPIKVMTGISAMAAGDQFSLILKNDNSLWACGNNRYGQLADGTNENKREPTLVMHDVKNIAAGSHHTLILKTDGSLWACGRNYEGQLGVGAAGPYRSSPVLVMADVRGMDGGLSHSLILKTDGSLWACGDNYYGQLGYGGDTSRLLPARVTEDVKSVCAGANHSLILKTDGSLWACGQNDSGELGDGTDINRKSPVRVTANVQSAAAGEGHSLILKTNGALWTCGKNQYGQLGKNTCADVKDAACCIFWPVPVASGVKSPAAGAAFSLMLKTDGSLRACGNNAHGQLGNAETGKRFYDPVEIKTDVESGADAAHAADNK